MAAVLRPRTALGGIGSSIRLIPRTNTTTRTAPIVLPLQQRRYLSGPYGYTQSKALVFSSFGEPSDALRLHTHSISPSLPDGAVLLRTLAAPINPADVNTIQGTYGAKPSFSPLLGTNEPSAIPGNEACFEVQAVGKGVQKFKKGDWVIPATTGSGTFRTHAVVEDAEKKLYKPGGDKNKEGLTAVQVATVSVNPCTAYRMLKDYVDLVKLSVEGFRRVNDPAEGGAWFLQNGANSGVGRAAIQLGKLWGLRSINVIRGRETPEETERLKQELMDLGATVVITEEAFLSREFREQLAGLTRGGKDPLLLAMNCVGGKSASSVVKALSPKGVMVTYGGMSRQSFPFPTGPQIFKRLRFEGFWLSEWGKENPEEKKKTVDEILQLMREGKFKEAPVQELKWEWDTEEKILKDAVQGTLEGFRSGKGVFVFGKT
ncbi:NONE-like protein [Cladorrhinum sp. PSN259]|nr:NONE-like protein [Cladorrhinum sp. PSN259]